MEKLHSFKINNTILGKMCDELDTNDNCTLASTTFGAIDPTFTTNELLPPFNDDDIMHDDEKSAVSEPMIGMTADSSNIFGMTYLS